MLALDYIVKHADEVQENSRRRGYEVDVARIVSLDRERRALQCRLDESRRQAKALAKSFSGVADDAGRERARALSTEEREVKSLLTATEQQLDDLVARVPNLLDARVPLGGEECNKVVRVIGSPPSFAFQPQAHETIGAKLNIIDTPRAVKAASARFYALKNEAVMLRMALVRMFCEHAMPQGFELVSPPVLAKDRSLFTSGYLPFSDKDNFRIQGKDLSLIGTSEQIILGMYMDEVLSRLPLLLLGDSLCFRTEAGAAGRDTTGILRAHQFYKLEQMVFCAPQDSEEWHLRCLANEEWILKELGIHYRVVICASEDVAAPGHMKYDTEAWLPSQCRFRELTSNTNLTDYQARRGNIRFRVGQQKGFVHTISATALVDRLIAVILEHYQTEDGSVRMPEALVPYMGGRTQLRAPSNS